MRAVISCALILGVALGARAQFLGGIFQQGATELKEYGQQIAALDWFIQGLEKGYRIVEGGLDSIGGITGDEYGLHRQYFAGLGVVNPAVGQMAEVDEILVLEKSVVNGMAAGIKRWQGSGKLTPAEMAVAGQMYAAVVGVGAGIVGELKEVLTDGVWVMGDADRVRRIDGLAGRMRTLAGLTSEVIVSNDWVVAERIKGN